MTGTTVARVGTVKDLTVWFDEKATSLAERLAPFGVNPQRMTRLALLTVQGNPGLLQCTRSSLFLAMLEAAALRLEPSNVLGHCYLVPYKNGQVKEAQFQLGYRGMIELAQRSGDVGALYANAAHEMDHFIFSLGAAPMLEHRPRLVPVANPAQANLDDLDPGPLMAFYAVAHFTRGGTVPAVDVMTVREVELVRRRAKSANSNSPWNTHYEAMGTKTVLRRLLWRGVRLSTEANAALAIDSSADIGESRRLYEIHPEFDGLRDLAEAVGEEEGERAQDAKAVTQPAADRLTQEIAESFGGGQGQS